MVVITAVLALAACDQPDKRKERAETLLDAAVEQFRSGGAPAEGMTSVEPQARAIATKRAAAIIPPQNARRVRFAIGTLVCKPKEWREAKAAEEAELIAQLPDLPDATPEEREALRAEEVRRIRRIKRQQQQQPIIINPNTPRPDLNRLPDGTLRNVQTMTRADTLQLNAQAKMLQALDKYGLSGQVATRDDGEIMVLVGTDAIRKNQFDGQNLQPLSFLALEDDDRPCPTDASPDAVKDDPTLATNCVIRELEDSGDFEYVEKDFIFEHQFARRPAASTLAVPNDPLWDLQWNLRDPGSEAEQSPGGAGFLGFWEDTATRGSRDVTIATIDTGIALDHPDFDQTLNLAPGWDMVSDIRMANDGDGRDNDPNDPGDLCDPSDPLAEDSFHGTHVAGTLGAAATNNRAGIAGSAWDVTIVPVRALGKCGGRMSDINDAIRWAGGLIPAEGEGGELIWNENPADIINLSIGLFRTCPTSMQDAIDSVVERGAIVVAAAGNAQLPAELYSPASCLNVITVGASDWRGHLSSYSNFGDQIDILAPGGDLDRDDDGDGRPDGILSTRPSVDCTDPLTGDSITSCYYSYEHGTSMAAPHVSAAFALLKAHKPGLTRTELIDTVLDGARTYQAEQCVVPCDSVSNGTPIEPGSDQCALSCGAGLLDLTSLSE